MTLNGATGMIKTNTFTQKCNWWEIYVYAFYKYMHLLHHSDLWLFIFARCILHHHSVFPLEGDCNHTGELSAPLHPQVPTQTLLSTQLLQVDLIKSQHIVQLCLLLENRKIFLPSFSKSCTQTTESNTDLPLFICSEELWQIAGQIVSESLC